MKKEIQNNKIETKFGKLEVSEDSTSECSDKIIPSPLKYRRKINSKSNTNTYTNKSDESFETGSKYDLEIIDTTSSEDEKDDDVTRIQSPVLTSARQRTRKRSQNKMMTSPTTSSIENKEKEARLSETLTQKSTERLLFGSDSDSDDTIDLTNIREKKRKQNFPIFSPKEKNKSKQSKNLKNQKKSKSPSKFNEIRNFRPTSKKMPRIVSADRFDPDFDKPGTSGHIPSTQDKKSYTEVTKLTESFEPDFDFWEKYVLKDKNKIEKVIRQ